MKEPYKLLVAGDRRQANDETKDRYGYKAQWVPVNPGMVDKEVLPADLIACEYRRPQ